MPAHEHLQNQLFTGQGSVDAQRRKRLLASSQRAIEDIDFAVDNKPYPKNEALEASDLKRWGPDPDPVDPANPTIFRFSGSGNPRINGEFYRSPEEMSSGPADYTLPNNDREHRVNVFGSTEYHPYRFNELDHDEDGPFHGLAQPTTTEGNEWADSTKSHMYMSRKEKMAIKLNLDYKEEERKQEYERDQDFINNPNLVPTTEHTRRNRSDGSYGRD